MSEHEDRYDPVVDQTPARAPSVGAWRGTTIDQDGELERLRAVVAAVEAMLADWDAWNGERDYEWKSSPKDRERLRAALETGAS